jgi:hypothetical protein
LLTDFDSRQFPFAPCLIAAPKEISQGLSAGSDWIFRGKNVRFFTMGTCFFAETIWTSNQLKQSSKYTAVIAHTLTVPVVV